MPRLPLLLALLLLATAFACVQAQKQTILLVVKDSVSRRPLQKATVVLISRKDSSYMEFGITDSLGKYLFRNVNTAVAGLVAVSMAGYTDGKLLLATPASRSKGKLKDSTIEIRLAPQFVALQDVVVGAKASPIRLRKDTLEFDADFFKTQPNAVLEDLLRKLPGVEIRNGNQVYVNGQLVSRMLVEGKEFFSSDPIVILKNLPAEIIAKVQVADDKRTIAKETRQQKDIPKVINLKLKKEVKSGMFGKFFGGAGTDNRYEAGGILNVFRDTLQVSLIGSSDNQSSTGFTTEDFNSLGGFGRADGLGSQNAPGITNRWGTGIETRHLGGVNANYNLGTTLQLNAQYFYNQLARREGSTSFAQQLLADTTQLSLAGNQGNALERNHKASASLRWKQDSTGYLTVQLKTDFGNNRNDGTATSKTFSPQVPLLSQSSYLNNNRKSAASITLNADYSKTFVKQHLDWAISTFFTSNKNDETALTNNRYSRIVNNFLPDSVLQQRNNDNPSRLFNLDNRFTKTWKDRHSLIWRTEYNNNNKTTGGNTYQYAETTGKYHLVPSLSVRLQQQVHWVNNQVYYRYSYKDFTIQPGFSVRNLLLRYAYNYDSIPTLHRSYLLFTPTISINYKGLSFDYDRHQPEPQIDDLRPVTDSSYPLYVRVGNPALRAPVNSYYTLAYYKYFDHSHININLRSSLQHERDAIVDTKQVFTDGKTIVGKANYAGIVTFDNWFNVGKSFNKNDWDYNINLTGYYRFSQSPLLLNLQAITVRNSNFSPSVDAFASYKSKYTWQLRYGASFIRTRSNDKTVQTANTTQYNLANTFYVKFHRRLWYDARLTYNLNPGVKPPFQKQWFFCDMALTASFMKKDRAQLKLSGYDLFNQNQGIYRVAYQNYIFDYKALVQRRYFMLTFLYTIRKL